MIWKDLDMQELDFNAVAHAHADWKNKLRHAIDNHEEVDADTLCKDNVCMFGKWLYDDATKKTMGGVEAYESCREIHAIFHKEAGKIAVEINRQNYAKAHDMLKSSTPYWQASTDVALSLHELRKAVSAK